MSEDRFLDQLGGNGFMLEVFMLQVALELARTKPDPEGWSRDFVMQLHHRLDENEARVGSDHPFHEIARQGVDRLGQALTRLLRVPRP